jgi:asparagine synthase (glutamine-hydrolysing)
VELSIANPEARIIEAECTLWVAAGLDDDGVEALRRDQNRKDIEARLCRRYGDASIVRLRFRDGRPAIVAAWKGLTSSHDVFYRAVPGEDIVVSDHFRNLLAWVPASERIPDQDALCDHFLFRTVPANATLCRAVERLGRGEALVVDLAGRRPRKFRFDRVEGTARPGDAEDYVDRIDQALGASLADHRHETGVATLFSGGVDSTLIQTYLPASVPAICYELPRYAHPFETDYARNAAELLGIGLKTVMVNPSDYLHRLETAIDAAGMPPPHTQFAAYQPLLELDYRRFLIGEQADAVFGIEMRKARLAAPFTSRLGRLSIRMATSVAPRGRRQRLRQLQQTARRLGNTPDSLEGYGARFGVYTDGPLAEAVFGETLVRRRLASRMALVRDTLEPAAPSSNAFLRHLETAQMVDFFCEDIMMCFRHLAYAYGKSIYSPFTTAAVFEAARTIPVEHRYLRGLEGKYLPKLLLKRRLPRYPASQRKGYTHTPFEDLYRAPLAEVWRRYPVPDLFEGKQRDRLMAQPSQMTWNAITLAIWQQRVAANPDLKPVPGTRVLSWGDATRL